MLFIFILIPVNFVIFFIYVIDAHFVNLFNKYFLLIMNVFNLGKYHIPRRFELINMKK